MNEYLKKFSEQLKAIREEKKVTIDQINTKTRIDKKFLEAIESGNFSIMPDVYMKAFIKEYSRAIDLDPSEVLEKFELANKGLNFDNEPENIEESSEVNEQTNPQKTKGAKTQKGNIQEEQYAEEAKTVNLENTSQIPEGSTKSLYYVLAGIIMMLFIYIIYITFLKAPSNDKVTEKPFEEIMLNKEMAKPNLDTTQQKVAQLELARQTPNIVKDDKVKINNEIITQPKNLELKIVANDKSWIRVVVDEKDNNEFILTDGMTKVLNADKQYFLHIGNSGAIKLYLNNKELEFSKELNRVRKLIVKKDGIEYLRRPSTN